MTGQVEMAAGIVDLLNDIDRPLISTDLLDALASHGFALVDMDGLENPAGLAYLREVDR